MPDAARFNPLLNMHEMLLVLLQPLLACLGNGNPLTAALLFAHLNKRLLLQEVEGRVDHAGAGGIVALGQVFDLFDELIAVAGIAGQDI